MTLTLEQLKGRSAIICGDCQEVLPKLPRAKMLFSDPPDNLGMKYKGFDDHWPSMSAYYDWLVLVLCSMRRANPDLIWLSVYYRHRPRINIALSNGGFVDWDDRWFYWYYTFGQQQETDFKNTHRPILRLMKSDAKVYPEAVKEESQRQRDGDKRAKEGGCIPGDIWPFPRVCGNYKERRKWAPNQHPEALMERIVKFSAQPGDLVIDLFGGSGTTLRVCQRLGIQCLAIEISRFACEKIAAETGAELIFMDDLKE